LIDSNDRSTNGSLQACICLPADKRVLEPLAAAGKTAVIPPKSNRKIQREYDKDLNKSRHLIENFFAKT